jgi:hypothetical protein
MQSVVGRWPDWVLETIVHHFFPYFEIKFGARAPAGRIPVSRNDTGEEYHTVQLIHLGKT